MCGGEGEGGSTPNGASGWGGGAGGAMVKCKAGRRECGEHRRTRERRAGSERKWTGLERAGRRGGEEHGPGRSCESGRRNSGLKERVEAARQKPGAGLAISEGGAKRKRGAEFGSESEGAKLGEPEGAGPGAEEPEGREGVREEAGGGRREGAASRQVGGAGKPEAGKVRRGAGPGGKGEGR